MDLYYRQNPIEKDYHGHPNYFMVWLVLMILFGVSLVADHLGSHTLAVVLIFGTAFIKMVLVVANFMHIKYEPKTFWVLPFFGLFSILVFIGLVYPDITIIERFISK